MKSKSIQFKILWITASIYLFTLSDVFISPSKVNTEICTELFTKVHPLSKYQRTYYYLHTNKHSYSISEKVYYSASVGETILIVRSALTSANRFVEVIEGNKLVKCNIQFISDSGLVILIFFTLVTILFMIFYDKIPYASGRMNLTFFLAIISIVLFAFHLRGALEM